MAAAIQKRLVLANLRLPGTDPGSDPQVAQKHGWPEPFVWSQALVNANDFDRFKALQWKIRTWDVWNFMDCDHRFGDDWPGRIPPSWWHISCIFFQNPVIWFWIPWPGAGCVQIPALPWAGDAGV
jgi:hypothetical protein